MGKTSYPKALTASVIGGASKVKRETRARLATIIASQPRAFVLQSPSPDGKSVLIHAVVMGDDKDDGRFAENLASAYNLLTKFIDGPGLEKGITAEIDRCLSDSSRLQEENAALRAQLEAGGLSDVKPQEGEGL